MSGALNLRFSPRMAEQMKVHTVEASSEMYVLMYALAVKRD